MSLERKFLQAAGEVIGAVRHFNDNDSYQLRIELLSDEAVKTSEIEGEFLDRVSVQSSLRRQFGLDTDDRQVRPQERGIAEMMRMFIALGTGLWVMRDFSIGIQC